MAEVPMFRDHSLVPAEAIRLAALGLLAEAPRRYADLAAEVRFLTSRIVGPAPELMGTSLELLRYEGLVSPVDGANADAELTLTSNGHTALEDLLRANLRAPSTDLGKLGLALKLRFLDQLPADDQSRQIALVIAACESERARLTDLRTRHGAAAGLFRDWLDHDIAQIDARIAWLSSIEGRQ
ncbi:MAG TPA: hypothetical protein VJN67_12940 [Stellaceae bacterium]|nr:hypothetical protein [Stellaceae bacterium]